MRLSKIIYEALAFYGAPGNYTKDPASGLDLPEAPVLLDAGSIARDLIAAIDDTPSLCPMTLYDARRINGNLVTLALYNDGTVPPVQAQVAAVDLATVSLEDMLHARRIIEMERRKVSPEDSRKLEWQTIETRLIAGIFCTLHYEPSCIITQTLRAQLCFMTHTDMADAADEDGEIDMEQFFKETPPPITRN